MLQRDVPHAVRSRGCGQDRALSEVEGFFSTVTMDDVQPYNTIFSLYDALTLGQPSHFATINASTLIGELYPSHGGNSEATQVNFVAAVPLGGGGAAQQEPQHQLWRVDRISGHVSRVPFPLGANRSQAVRGLFVVPAGAAGGAAEKGDDGSTGPDVCRVICPRLYTERSGHE